MDWHIIQGKLNQSEDTRNIQIERQLGVGGFAVVYDIGAGEVLKVIDCNRMAKKANIVEKEEPQFFEKLLREVRINDDLRANANSPYLLIANSCFMLENMMRSGRLERILCLKMPKMAGTFREYADMVPFSEEIVVNVARDIARAMKTYNSSKVKLVHRDISPTNIFVNMDKSSEARFVLGDFGIAKPIIKGNKSVSSVTGLGNKEYASPEQLQGEQLDIRSDIYSLGIVLSQYVTEKGALQIKNGKGCISEEVARIIEKMTRKNIEERYRSVEDLLLDIEEYSMIKQQEKDEIEKLPEQYKALAARYEVMSEKHEMLLEKYEQLNIQKNNLKGQIVKLEKNKNIRDQVSRKNNEKQNMNMVEPSDVIEDLFQKYRLLESVELPDSITSIPNIAFKNSITLKNIILPKTLTSIGEHAFSGCSKLEHIEMMKHVANIGKYAFDKCSSLENIEIPDSVTQMGRFAFSRCGSLAHIKISKAIKCIEECTFIECTSLESIEIPDSVERIGYLAFYGCEKLKMVKVSSGCSIARDAFGACNYSLQIIRY